MYWWFRKRIRHPLFPGLRAAQAAKTNGRHTALVGTVGELKMAATRGARAHRAIFVLEPLESPTRDELWRLFQVPSYILLLDPQGRVRAYECEARQGLHRVRPKASESTCDCGRPGLEAQPEYCTLPSLKIAV